MGRPKRIQFAGACYFITLKGNNRQDIFLSNQDRRQFLMFLRNYREHYGLKIYAYCLLSNQVLLLLETSQPNLSSVMQIFNTSYTKYFNAAHNTMGHVFQGRYQALLVDPEAFLMEMTRYVHLATVRAGLRESPWRYQWSSCGSYITAHREDALVDSAAVLGRFAKIRLVASVRYLKYLKERMKSASELILPIVRSTAIGHEAFLSRVEAKHLGGAEQSLGTARLEAAVLAKKIIAETALAHGFDEERLLGRAQWRDVSELRHQAVYRIWKETRMGVTEIARLFNRTPSSISQIIRSMDK